MAEVIGRRRFVERALGAAAATVVGCDESVRHRGKAGATPRYYDDPRAGTSTTPVSADALPDGLDARDFSVYTRTPLTLEARRENLGTAVVTPVAELFVRNNLPLPAMQIVDNAQAWRLRVRGVKQPQAFTPADLKQLPTETVTTVLQCSGNGRRFFEHGPSGSQWGVGAAGCVQWTGVRCRDVIAAAGGAVPAANFLTAAGGDPIPELPPGMSPDLVRVERSIPLAKGLDDAMLVWALNDRPLPLTHGGPLRLIVPGYYGVNNVKYVNTLACTAEQSTARIQQTSYRLRPVGTKGAPSQPSMWRMAVKSWVSGPGGDGKPVLAGRARIYGVAFSGERGVKKVEVSTDGGQQWTDVPFAGADLGPNAWRTFSHEVTLSPGRYALCSRATDSRGDVQPRLRQDNARGYGNNAWADHALEIEVFDTLPERLPPEAEAAAAAQPAEPLSAQALRGRDVFMRHATPQCGNCHALADAQTGMAIGPNLDQTVVPRVRVRNAVENGVGIMPSYANRLTPAQLDDLTAYVVAARGR